jgi:hypothetical protein
VTQRHIGLASHEVCLFDPIVRLAQAELGLDQGHQSLSIRRLNRLQLGQKSLVVLSRPDAVKTLRGGFALGNLLVGAAHQLQKGRLVFPCDGRRLHQQ